MIALHNSGREPRKGLPMTNRVVKKNSLTNLAAYWRARKSHFSGAANNMMTTIAAARFVAEGIIHQHTSNCRCAFCRQEGVRAAFIVNELKGLLWALDSAARSIEGVVIVEDRTRAELEGLVHA